MSSKDSSFLYKSVATTLPQVKGDSLNSTGDDSLVLASVLSLVAELREWQDLSPHNLLGETPWS